MARQSVGCALIVSLVLAGCGSGSNGAGGHGGATGAAGAGAGGGQMTGTGGTIAGAGGGSGGAGGSSAGGGSGAGGGAGGAGAGTGTAGIPGGAGGSAGMSGGGSPGGAGGSAGSGGTSGIGGSSGAGGTGQSPGEGRLATCPDVSPAHGDACTSPYVLCLYPTKSCSCDKNGTWHCADCPASPPQPYSICSLSSSNLAFSCQYPGFTCSCNSSDPIWECGLCQSSRPTQGGTCGTSMFECRYGSSDICLCKDGAWECGTPTCPVTADWNGLRGNPAACTAPGFYSCRFPEQDQNCLCGPEYLADHCSCPAAPVEGGPCVPNSSHCPYNNALCSCGSDGTWGCVPTVCPTSKPTPGSSCSAQLSCTYNGSFCACDGTSWTCS